MSDLPALVNETRSAEMALRSEAQNKAFHRLIGQHRFDREEKAEIVSLVSGGRTQSSAELSEDEMQKAIDRLNAGQLTSIKKMRAKIYNIARDIFGLRERDTFEQKHYDAVDKFMRDKYKAPLRHLTYEQLPDAVTSMEAWRRTATRQMIQNY